ncbi:MAG: sulfotransferase [Planctomycetota bacterium]
MKNEERTAAWQRNDGLEGWLGALTELMTPAQALCNERDASEPDLPVVVVVGAPRSGTTLLMQTIAAGGLCAYPTNFLGRFYGAPGVGARIQRLLFDSAFQFRDEFHDLRPKPPGFESALGKTRGALSPSEFWYFWRRFLPTSEIEPIGSRMDDVDLEGLATELRTITSAFEMPFAAKGMMLQYDVAAFGRALPKLLFVHVKRDAIANASSILDARRSFFGTEETWYSAKPREYEDLKGLSPEEQAIGQVEFTNRSIAEGIAELGPEQSLSVQYDEFCADPAAFHRALASRLRALAPELEQRLDVAYTGPPAFTPTRTRGSGSAGESSRTAALQKAHQRLSR